MLRHILGPFDNVRSGLAGFVIAAVWLVAGSAFLQAETADTKSPKAISSVARIQRALDEHTEVEFVETPLTDVIDFLKTRHQTEIQLDTHALTEANVAFDTQITRNLKGITLRSALRLTLRDLHLKYVIQDEVVMITTAEIANSMLETRIYPVRDLLSKEVQDDGGTVDDYASLLAAVASADTLTTQKEHREGTVHAVPSVAALVVSQTQETHEKIEDLLAALRKAREQFKE